MKKGLLAITCLLALSLVLAACSDSTSSQPAPAQPESVAEAPQAASSTAQEAASAPVPKAEPEDVPATDGLDEEVAVTAYCIAFGEDPSQYTPEYREEIELVFAPEGDDWGVFTGNRGGATFVVLDGASATVVDTGSIGDITFVKIIDMATEEVVFDFYDLNPSTGDSNGSALDDAAAAQAYALAYGYDPADYTVEDMKAMDFTFNQNADNQITLHGNRGGGWTIVRVNDADTVIDFGSTGDPFIVSVVDTTSGELIFQTPYEA